MKPIVAGLLAAFVLPLAGISRSFEVESVVRRLEPEIERAMAEGNIPSCTVALVSREATLWSGAYGYSNLWARTPATVDTVYLIGSTYKTLSTAALLQLMEAGELELDDPVRRYLGDLPVRGEDPRRPITFRHLLTHTSGLPAAFGPHEVWGDSVPPPLAGYLRLSLEVKVPPMQDVVYSNLAYTLIAHLIETIGGIDYRRYMKEQIFAPLGMSSTVFKPTPQVTERLAVPYVPDPETGRPVASARLKANVWPAGIVYGTIGDQARWLRAVLRGGELDGKRILQPETVASTLELQYEELAGPMHAGWGNETSGYGLTWWTARKQGERHFAHSGSVPGYTAFLEGNADGGVGFAILTNGHRAHPHLIRLAALALRLLDE